MAKLGVAVIGVGARGPDIITGFQRCEDAEVLTICDINTHRLREVAEQFKIEHTVTDWRELLDDDRIDVVAIVTPEHLHVEPTVAALKAGKHVFLEKPMDNTLARCKEIMRAVEKTGMKVTVGQNMRYFPEIQAVKKAVDAGEIGDFYYVAADCNWNYEHMMGEGWKADKRLALIGRACHPIDILRYVTRDMAGEIMEVSAYSNHMVLPEYNQDDCYILNFKFESGCIGRLLKTIAFKGPPEWAYKTILYLYGTKGTIYRNLIAHWYKENEYPDTTQLPGPEPFAPIAEIQEVEYVDTSNQLIAEFVEAIINDQAPPVSAHEAYPIYAVGFAAMESIRNGGVPIKVDYDIWSG